MAGTYGLLWAKLFSPESKVTGVFKVPGAGSKATSAGNTLVIRHFDTILGILNS